MIERMQSVSDKAILKKLESAHEYDHRQAFEWVNRLYFSLATSFVLKNHGTHQDAEEIFDDAFLVLFSQVKSGSLELTCALSTYLYSICRNIWLDRLRKAKRDKSTIESLEFVEIEESVLEMLVHAESHKAIASLVKKLGAACQLVLRYFYFERRTMNEIAELMQLQGSNAAKTKKYDCLQQLKKMVMNNDNIKGMLRR
jgi:RNA polymerase sigma factor (sigma-70 family)